ncbi:response regulator [Pedosphaera parvula]|uniref:Two component transcriptional regulator, LuxR family n=1 Tax=Pedosphaera parvula (strain Ellin514) TaxID=320771 RepID=B9XKP4_PEDPL|nr:response regulator transcription factor [Pedosphaera parvula]EEF59537.1 two component transcriptional regulator, LuxR family [Pedosphaera parvula Ellin514]
MQKITVLLADDHIIVRQGLRALLAAAGDVEVVGEAGDGREAVELTKKLSPQVVVMDLAMPKLNGLEATRQIVKNKPGIKVVVLSSYSDQEYVQKVMEAGALGYLVKQSAADDLLTAIREVYKGNNFFSPAIAKGLSELKREAFTNGHAFRESGVHLTAREREVLQLIAEGRANKQIADDLAISIKTVEKHRQQVMNKLNIHDVASLTRYAISKGMVEKNAVPLL